MAIPINSILIYDFGIYGSHQVDYWIRILDLFNIYVVNTHLGSNQTGLVKSILVNDILLSLVFMIIISSMNIEEYNLLMFGIFVPKVTGHIPIDFRQMMKYNCFKQLRRESLIKPHPMWSRAT